MPLRNIAALGVVYKVKKTKIGHIVFDLRKEENPCSLCARMRRVALHDIDNDWGCNKVALGHHAESRNFYYEFVPRGQNRLFFSGGLYQPKKYDGYPPYDICRRKGCGKGCKNCTLPIVKSKCPADKATNRQTTKKFLHELERQSHGIKKRMLGALKLGHVSGW